MPYIGSNIFNLFDSGWWKWVLILGGVALTLGLTAGVGNWLGTKVTGKQESPVGGALGLALGCLFLVAVFIASCGDSKAEKLEGVAYAEFVAACEEYATSTRMLAQKMTNPSDKAVMISAANGADLTAQDVKIVHERLSEAKPDYLRNFARGMQGTASEMDASYRDNLTRDQTQEAQRAIDAQNRLAKALRAYAAALIELADSR